MYSPLHLISLFLTDPSLFNFFLLPLLTNFFSSYFFYLNHPLFRYLKFTRKIFTDVCKVLLLGKRCVLQCLLKIRSIFEHTDSHYLLNKVFLGEHYADCFLFCMPACLSVCLPVCLSVCIPACVNLFEEREEPVFIIKLRAHLTMLPCV